MTRGQHETTASFEAGVAPHVEARWAEEFIMELRLGSVAGTEIGAALAEVESYCADSGEQAIDAFGPPIDYARALNLETSAVQSPRRILAGVLPTLAQLAGMSAVVWSAPALARGDDLALTMGMIINMVILALTLGAISLWSEPVLRLILFRPWIAWVVFMVVITAAVVPVATLREPVLTVAAAAALGGGTLVLLVGLAGEIAQTRRASRQNGQDVLAAPLEGSGRVMMRARRGRWLSGLRIALIPAATVVLAAVGFFLA